MAAWELRREERQLEEMAHALEIVKECYATALGTLREPASRRSAQVESLEGEAKSVQDAVEAVLSPGSTLALLSVNSKSLMHTQKLAEDKMDETRRIERDQLERFVPGGQMDKLTTNFGSGYRDGTARKVVRQAERIGALVEGIKGKLWMGRASQDLDAASAVAPAEEEPVAVRVDLPATHTINGVDVSEE